ncbi:MAG: hypothetical protein LKJ21_07395 [Oscillospiraceae bacterium]|jgi:GNAT superfamily N-acetyltransferase|nr:hypothetical protein [Oscillospiraceae bacterium]MCI2035468.1 hypothetical protein [Oscillospiraceae bacterium]
MINDHSFIVKGKRRISPKIPVRGRTAPGAPLISGFFLCTKAGAGGIIKAQCTDDAVEQGEIVPLHRGKGVGSALLSHCIFLYAESTPG